MDLRREPNLLTAPAAVFRIWNFRKKIEAEAASIFGRISEELSLLRGPDDPIARLAREAADDELRHIKLCDRILSANQLSLASDEQGPTDLGPRSLSRDQKLLYSCVAMGCVTESLSTALLIQMHDKANSGIIKETVHSILKDEINHSRIGWAELARFAEKQDVKWLEKYIPGMIQDALGSEISSMFTTPMEPDFSEWGILPRSYSLSIMHSAIEEVLRPGFAEFGICI